MAVANGPEADGLFAALEPYQKSKDGRLNLALSLRKLRETTDPEVKTRATFLLLELLKDPDEMVMRSASSSLERFGPSAAVIIPQLEEVIRSDEGTLRTINVIFLLGGMGDEANGSVPVIAGALNYRMRWEGARYLVRKAAAVALMQMGKDAVSREAVAKAIAVIEGDEQR